MFSFDSFCEFLVRFSILSFVLLGGGWFTLRLVRQPVEKIRLIQITMVTLLAVTLLSLVQWRPTINLAWLPERPNPELADRETPRPALARSTPEGKNETVATKAQPVVPTGETRIKENKKKSEARSQIAEFQPAHTTIREPIELTNTTATKSRFDWTLVLQVVALVVVVGSMIQCMLLVLGFWCTARLRRNSTAIHELPLTHLTASVRHFISRHQMDVKVSEKILVPIATGIFRPVVLLPESMVLNGKELEVQQALQHEWKHIQQKDLISWYGMSLCQILLWYQPFFWLIRRELRVNQDLIADDAATSNQDRADYAETLLRFAAQRNSTMTGALTMAGTKSNLFRRIDMLLNRHFPIASMSRKRVMIAFSIALFSMAGLLASIQITAAASKNGLNPFEGLSSLQDDEKSKDAKPAEKKATEPVTHRGIIYDPINKKPVANATVIVTRMNSKTWKEIAKTESKTNDKGEYSFEIPVDQLNEPYLYLLFDLRHETYAPRHCGSYSYSMIKKNLKLGDKPWFSKLNMLPGAEISARVVDKAGDPVAGAAVRVSSEAPTGDQRDFSRFSSTKTKTDSNGRFKAVVTKDGIAKFSLIPAGHCILSKDIGAKRGDLGEIEVSDGFSISGKVVDARGKALENMWVNITPMGTRGSYEAQRSSTTDSKGEFKTRVISPGKYTFKVETKATGALEKKEYANFNDAPPPAVFVRQVMEITEASASKPIVIQAVPHIFIRGQGFDSKGKKRSIHMPYILGSFDGQPVFLQGRKLKEKGSFELMVPHGIERARLNISTNEHSALLIQLGPDKKPTTERSFEYDKLEADILDIRVTRYTAPILQVKVVDQDGKQIKNAQVGIVYDGEDAPDSRLVGIKTHVFFEKQTNGVFRSSSLVPERDFKVFAEKKGFKSETKKLQLKEAAEKQITIMLTPQKDSSAGEDEAKMMKKKKDD